MSEGRKGHTGGVALLVAVAELRAQLDRIDYRPKARRESVLHGEAFRTWSLGVDNLLQSDILSLVRGKSRTPGIDLQSHGLHHVAHREIESDDFVVVLAASELELDTGLEK